MDQSRDAAMLWTGGKDSALAFHEAAQQGLRVRCLVTFAPPQPDFLAHPLSVIRLQAQAVELPHHVLYVNAPAEEDYEVGLRWLRDEMDIGSVITGDISEVDGHPNWIRERCRPLGMSVHTPLWERDREALLRQLVGSGFEARLSCVDTRWLASDWIGRTLDISAIADLRGAREQNGLDMCGENGEYHTLVVDGPSFTRRIDLGSYAVRTADSLAYMRIQEAVLAGDNTHSAKTVTLR
jgi:diphthine-ammonia ligase